VCPLLVIALSVCFYLGWRLANGTLYSIGSYGWLALVTLFTFAWAWTLYKLYRDTVHSAKLLPDKRIFKLHASLLVCFILMTALNNYAYWTATITSNKTSDDWGGVSSLALFLGNLFEALTFVLVVLLMLPMGEH